MKQKFYLVVLCLIVALQVQAQSTAKLSNIKWEGMVEFNSSKLSSMGSRIGFGVGVKGILEMPTIADGIYLSSGAFLERKGADLDLDYLGGCTSSSYYLDIPIHIGYHYSVNPEFAIFGEAGPYIGVGLFGNSKIKWLDEELYKKGKIKHNERTVKTFDALKRFDVGLGLQVGVELAQKFTISIGYDYGLIDLSKGSNWEKEGTEEDPEGLDSTPGAKNRSLSIKLGYKF